MKYWGVGRGGETGLEAVRNDEEISREKERRDLHHGELPGLGDALSVKSGRGGVWLECQLLALGLLLECDLGCR